MAATRKARGKRHARGKAVERRSSSRIQELVVRPAVASATAALSAAAGVETPREVELTDAEIEATLRYADALDADVKRALIVLRKEAARHASSKPREFTIPFTPEEIKTIGHRKTVRHPPPFKRISKSIYLSTTLPVADLPVHKCNCYDDKAATSSTSRRAKVANTAPEPVVKKRGKKVVAKAPSKPTELYCGEGCHNRMLFISCSKETCSAPDPSLCTNRAIKRREAKPVRVEYVEGPGFGLFAEETIEPGEFVIEYVGEVIDDEECERRLIKYRDEGEEHFYMLEIEKDVVIDARYRSNDARFINHSCDPNSMTQKWNVDGLRRIGIFARRRIMPGEEITIDYNFSHFGDPMDCKCGSVACTGKLGLKRSDVQIKNALPIYKKSQEVVDAAPPEIKRPVLLSSLALLKSAKLDANWLNLYGFKKRRLFVGHRNGELGKKATPKSTSEAPSSSLVSSRNSSPLSSEWSATTNEDMDVPKNDWYNRFQRGDHLDEMRAMQSYICGGKYDWTDDLMDIPPRSRRTPPPSRKNKRLVTKRVGLLDARTNRFSDLIAFANGASAWNKRVPSSSNIDPGRIYRFIDAMKSGKLFLNQNLNDLNEDACHRCGLAGELICCDGCPAAFHLNCTNLVMLPPHGEPWFCSDCKRSARQRAKVEALTSTTSVPSTSTDGAAAGKRHNLRTLTNNTSTTAPVVPSLKRIFHAISTKDRTRRRPRKKLKSADKSYRLLEQMPLPVWDDEDE